jgi:hypothetical protein
MAIYFRNPSWEMSYSSPSLGGAELEHYQGLEGMLDFDFEWLMVE